MVGEGSEPGESSFFFALRRAATAAVCAIAHTHRQKRRLRARIGDPRERVRLQGHPHSGPASLMPAHARAAIMPFTSTARLPGTRFESHSMRQTSPRGGVSLRWMTCTS
jgi:hypothetical protein